MTAQWMSHSSSNRRSSRTSSQSFPALSTSSSNRRQARDWGSHELDHHHGLAVAVLEALRLLREVMPQSDAWVEATHDGLGSTTPPPASSAVRLVEREGVFVLQHRRSTSRRAGAIAELPVVCGVIGLLLLALPRLGKATGRKAHHQQRGVSSCSEADPRCAPRSSATGRYQV